MKAILYSFVAVLMTATAVYAQSGERSLFLIPPEYGNMELESMFGANLENGDFQEGDWVVDADGIITSPGYGEIWTKENTAPSSAPLNSTLKQPPMGVLGSCRRQEGLDSCTIEVQLLGDAGHKPSYHTCLCVLRLSGSCQKRRKRGKWNKMTVVALGTRLMVELNGRMVNMIDTSEWTDNVKESARTDIEEKFRGCSLASREPYSYIGFQGEHSNATIRYRNIKIARLPEPESK